MMSGFTDMSVFKFNALQDALPTSHNNNENVLNDSSNMLNMNNSNICSLLSNSSNNSSNNNNNNEAILTAALRAHLNYTNQHLNSADLDENELIRTLNKIAISNIGNNSSNINSAIMQKCIPPTAGSNGNWKCDSCNNINYARRLKCNRCTLPRFSNKNTINNNNNNNNSNSNNNNSNNNNNIAVSNLSNFVQNNNNNNKVNQMLVGGRNVNMEYLNVGGGKNVQIGDLAADAVNGGMPTSTELLMTNFLNNSAGVMGFGDSADDLRTNSANTGGAINQLFLPNVMLQHQGNYDLNSPRGTLESMANLDSAGGVSGLCYNNNAIFSHQLLQNNVSNNSNFSNITSAAHHLLSNLPFLACSPALTPTVCSTAMTPHTSTGGISPTTIASPSTVDTILPPTFTPLQIMLLKAKDVADKLLSDFQNLGDLDPLNKAVEVLKTALAMLGYLCDFKNNQSSAGIENNPLQVIGGPNFSAPTMLAHPDEFKNPSSFLKIYGDPLCSNGASIAAGNGLTSSCISNLSAINPVKGQNGNWICRKCSNINFPRRFRCNKCNEYRDAEGDEIVSDYAKTIYHQHLRVYRSLAAKKGIDMPLKRFGGAGSSQRTNRSAEKVVDRGGINGGNTPVSGN